MAFPLDTNAKPRSEMDSANQQSDDPNVDITECGNPRDDEFGKEEVILCQSSSSSSFGDSMCAGDDDGFGDEEEAQSMLSKDYPLPDKCDVVSECLKLRKKKLTDKWRQFIQPVSWRSKWLELKANEMLSRAREYDKEVKSYYDNKQFDLEKSKFEGLEGKSIPFRDQTQRMKVFKRGIRKRLEETTNVADFISNHNVFSYSEKRMSANLKAQYSAPDLGTGRKATSKEDDIGDDCLVSELDSSDGFLAKLLCKIDEAQERAKRLRKRLDQLPYESSMPQTRDLAVQNDKQILTVPPHTVARTQTEAAVQIGRQRISADHHTDDVLIPQATPIQIDGQCLIENSPIPSFRFHPLLEGLLMDEPEMSNDETEVGEEHLDLFRKLMNEITGVPPEEADAEEDPTPVTKKPKTSH